MNSNTKKPTSATTHAIEISIRLGLIILILYWCLKILSPFTSVLIWGTILAVALYKPFLFLLKKLGNNRKLAVLVLTLISIGLILVPVILLSGSLLDSTKNVAGHINAGTVHISPPAEAVRDWPVIGEKAYTFWQSASADLSQVLAKYPEQIRLVGKTLLGHAAGIGLGILQFVISLLIAAAFLANEKALTQSAKRFARRLSSDDGEALLTMSINTIRSVAVGVIGIAFIQAVLGGLGMMVLGVPAAGILAGIILILAIAQLPPWLILGPVIVYVFSVESTLVASLFMVWSLLVSFSDMVLKPMLLGRGVDAPMLVILLGAIGGMITAGIVGLFIGAVILAVGYKLFQAWLAFSDEQKNAGPGDKLAEQAPTE